MDEKLIELVRVHEELYDTSNRRYNDTVFKERVWIRIGEELNKTGHECKQRWVSLRDQYRRSLRKIATRSGPETGNKGKYKYAEEMAFVKPFLRERERLTNLEHDGASVDVDVEVTEEDGLVILPQKKMKCIGDYSSKVEKFPEQEGEAKKPAFNLSLGATKSPAFMKYSIAENDKEEHFVDPTDLFFQTMAATVKKFSPYYQNVCKTKVFAVVSELEMKHILHQISPVENVRTIDSGSHSHHSGESTENFQNL